MEAVKRQVLCEVAERFGSPCYVYFLEEIRERAARIREAFEGRFRISYAVKSNPNPALLRALRGVTDMVDVSSGGEVLRVLECGWPAESISFTGPGKRDDELRLAVERRVGEIVVESVDEIRALGAIAGGAGAPVLIRIAPARVPRGFGLRMSGAATPFGVDDEEAAAAVRAVQEQAGLELAGLHIYSGTQCLQAEAIAENYEIFADIFRRVCEEHDLRPRKLIFGSGIGIPYYDNDAPVDLDELASRANPLLDDLRAHPRFADAELVLELGRYLVGEAGIYVTQVVRTKRSRGVDIAICDGGMNHHLGAAGHLGTVIPRNYRMERLTGEAGEEPSEIVGPLCTTIDVLGRKVKLGRLAAGDRIGIHCSGAYGVTASPVYFIRHPPPKEVLVDRRNGEWIFEDATQFEMERPPAAGRRAQ